MKFNNSGEEDKGRRNRLGSTESVDSDGGAGGGGSVCFCCCCCSCARPIDVLRSVLDVINVRDIFDDAATSFDDKYTDYGQANLMSISNGVFGGGSAIGDDLENQLDTAPSANTIGTLL
jgi:hypothetical protein